MLVTTADTFYDALEALLEEKEYGFDTETTGVGWDDRLFSIIFATDRDVYYFNFQDYPLEGVRGLDRKLIQELQPIFRPDATFFVSNAKFDMRMLRHEGPIPHGNFFCTTAQGRVLKNNHIKYGLADSAIRAFGNEHMKDDAVELYIRDKGLFSKRAIPGKKTMFVDKRFWEVPLAIMQPYAEQDARLHLKLGRHLQGEIQALENPRFDAHPRDVMATELALTGVCHQMEWDGIECDIAYVIKAQAHEDLQVLRHKELYKELTGGRDFVDSNKGLFEAFTECGYTTIPRTEKGNPSFTDAVLEDLEGPLADSVRRIRHHSKRNGTYYSSFLHFADKSGRVHPNMKQGGTETGRFSYSDPNLQNVPKEDNDKDAWFDPESIVRRAFKPRDGYCLVAIDYKQQEYRII